MVDFKQFFYLFVNLTSRLSFAIFHSISSYALPIHVNLFLCLCQSKFTYIFFNFPFFISFYPSSINVNVFLSSCQSIRCLSLPITNFKLSFYLSLFLFTTKEDQFTTKIFYILFLWGWLYFMTNEVMVFPYVKWSQYFLKLHSSFRGKNRYQVYKYETGNDIYVLLGKTIRSVKPNHWRHFFALSSVNNIQFINNQVSYNN